MKNYWNIALFISLFLHAFGIAGFTLWPRSKVLFSPKKATNEVRPIKEIKVTSQRATPNASLKTNGAPDEPAPPYVENILDKLVPDRERNISLDKAETVEESAGGIIIAEIVDKDLMKLPQYQAYYNSIRSRLYNAAYRRYKGESGGVVVLSFTILSDGRLEAISFMEGTADDAVLRDIAIKSLYDAAPFPALSRKWKDRTRLDIKIAIEFKAK